MAQHNADETKILDSKAVIYKNEYGVWQFRYWLTTENKYVRKSLRTKVKTKAKEDAEDLYFKIRVEQKEGRRYFAISVKQAVEDFLNYQKTRIGEGDFNIVEGRFKTIETQMNTFLEYVLKDDKITDLDENTLRRYERKFTILHSGSIFTANGLIFGILSCVKFLSSPIKQPHQYVTGGIKTSSSRWRRSGIPLQPARSCKKWWRGFDVCRSSTTR